MSTYNIFTLQLQLQVSAELLQWREAVEEALLQMGDIFLDCAQFLATKITAGVGPLVSS